MIERVVQARRADFPCGKRQKRAPILAAVLHELLHVERFEAIGDVAEALKRRAAKLRIPYDATTITEALHVVGHTRPLVVPGRRGSR